MHQEDDYPAASKVRFERSELLVGAPGWISKRRQLINAHAGTGALLLIRKRPEPRVMLTRQLAFWRGNNVKYLPPCFRLRSRSFLLLRGCMCTVCTQFLFSQRANLFLFPFGEHIAPALEVFLRTLNLDLFMYSI